MNVNTKTQVFGERYDLYKREGLAHDQAYRLAARDIVQRDAHKRGHAVGACADSLECAICGASCAVAIVDGKAIVTGNLSRGDCRKS